MPTMRSESRKSCRWWSSGSQWLGFFCLIQTSSDKKDIRWWWTQWPAGRTWLDSGWWERVDAAAMCFVPNATIVYHRNEDPIIRFLLLWKMFALCFFMQSDSSQEWKQLFWEDIRFNVEAAYTDNRCTTRDGNGNLIFVSFLFRIVWCMISVQTNFPSVSFSLWFTQRNDSWNGSREWSEQSGNVTKVCDWDVDRREYSNNEIFRYTGSVRQIDPSLFLTIATVLRTVPWIKKRWENGSGNEYLVLYVKCDNESENEISIINSCLISKDVQLQWGMTCRTIY